MLVRGMNKCELIQLHFEELFGNSKDNKQQKFGLR